MKNRFLIPILGVAFSISGCESPTPTEPQADVTPSLTAAPKKAIPCTAVMDITGPIPGFPNVINPECITVDAGTGTAYMKKCIVVGSLTGDLVGTVSVEFNGHQDLLTLATVARGHFNFDVCLTDFGCGAFEGPYRGESGPGGQGKLWGNAHGTGAFHTLQFRASVVERGNTEIFDLDGVIF